MLRSDSGKGERVSTRQAMYDGNFQNAAGASRVEPGQSSKDNDMGDLHLLEEYNNKYREMIDLVDRLREYGLERELPLPQVVVVGVQTSGKSSVLEGISGVQLPRGTGIVTRCPIELRLKASDGPWAGRVHCENEKGERMEKTLRSPDEVTNNILQAQTFLAGASGISTRRIVLEVKSPNIPDLTLIDLPGLIEVAMDGQPEDIVEKVQNIVNHYISRKETIIMVVAPCTMELATTRALKMALEVDPDGIRTLGVLTKPDLVDRGAEDDIVKMVRFPDQYKIRKGFTVVKLRSKEDITTGMSLQVALKREKEWFAKSPQFRELPDMGTQCLAVKLSHELEERIKSVLPTLKSDVYIRMEDVHTQLGALSTGIPNDNKERRQLLTDLLNAFTDKFVRICEGNYDRNVPTDQRLLFWTRPFLENFATIVGELMPDESNRRLLERVDREVREHRGMELPGFLSWLACKGIIQRLLDGYRTPSADCLNKINSVVGELLRKLAEEKFVAYPRLLSIVKAVVDHEQKLQVQACRKAVDELFDIEEMVVVTDVLFYRGIARAAKGDMDSDVSPQRPNIDVMPGVGDTLDTLPRQPQKRAGLFNRNKHREARPRPVTPGLEKAALNGAPEATPADTGSEREGILGPQPVPSVYIPAAESEMKHSAEFTLDRIVIYFRTALERLMGTVPARIHFHLIHRLSLDIKSRVTNLGTDVTTHESLVEDEKTAAIRAGLIERRDCLQKSLDQLNKF